MFSRIFNAKFNNEWTISFNKDLECVYRTCPTLNMIVVSNKNQLQLITTITITTIILLIWF